MKRTMCLGMALLVAAILLLSSCRTTTPSESPGSRDMQDRLERREGFWGRGFSLGSGDPEVNMYGGGP